MALTRDRDTPAKTGHLRTAPAAAGVVIHAGALVVLQGGLARPGLAATGLIALGRARHRVDNSTGAAGDHVVEAEPGVFLFKNAALDPVAPADLGATCFVLDDETVAKTNGGGARSAAGVVRGIEPAGVWVEIR